MAAGRTEERAKQEHGVGQQAALKLPGLGKRGTRSESAAKGQASVVKKLKL